MYVLGMKNPYMLENWWLRWISFLSSFTTCAGSVLMFVASLDALNGKMGTVAVDTLSWLVVVLCFLLLLLLVCTFAAGLWLGAEKEAKMMVAAASAESHNNPYFCAERDVGGGGA